MSRFLTVSLACLLAFSWSTGYTAEKAYKYMIKITASAPKGSLAEAAFKDKTKPSTIAFTPCNDDDEFKQDVVSFKLEYDAGKVKTNKDKTKDYSSIKDVYFFFYNPNALGALADVDEKTFADNPFEPPCKKYESEDDKEGTVIPCDPKVWAVVRSTPYINARDVGSIALEPLAEVSDINPKKHIYLSTEENIGTGKVTEQLLRTYIRFDGSQQGIWGLVGIIASKSLPEAPETDEEASDEESVAVVVDFTDPSTWAAWDTATFMLGTPWTALSQDEDSKTCK
jgi:hypothetical protein